MEKVYIKLLGIILFLGFFIQQNHAQTLPVFKENDKVCFIGNSITQDGRYHMLFQTYFATQFPGNNVSFYNCGVSGDVTEGVLYRLDKDILSLKPDYAFVMLGMNDIQLGLYESGVTVDSTLIAKRKNALNRYYELTEELSGLLKKNDIKTIFFTPTIYDQTSKIECPNKFGGNDALADCAVHIRKLAKKYNAPLVDFHPLMSEINAKGQERDSTFTIIGHDRVHPGDVGHFIMASEIIKTIYPPDVVSKIHINAKENTITQSVNCDVTIIANPSKLKFHVLEKSLPFPVASKYDDALDLISFPENFNKQIIKVDGLKKRSYRLKIDGISIGEFSKKELEGGIDLSKYKKTPQYKQALDVFNLCEAYHKVNGKLRTIALIEYKNLRKYKGPNINKDKRAYLDEELKKQEGKPWHPYLVKMCNQYFEVLPKQDALWQELKDVRGKIYQQNVPVSHTYELIKI
ncbi:SGNH/GDSL hydrolase family protein [Flavivirga eckloniae]|uniref:SGNH hydrolase-type esterase domain-containing protein n=1 Tax=Flavivirga eckloniae TaxID=1803846 RepID=A0A2K9PU09_9FLAO|nr:SGNH/GDSL hydrolase family protein [Flavivirga eckloniae]AUP80546.1 hypothetical protein C1H87_18235 [Flavivirga eckloniae]